MPILVGEGKVLTAEGRKRRDSNSADLCAPASSAVIFHWRGRTAR